MMLKFYKNLSFLILILCSCIGLVFSSLSFYDSEFSPDSVSIREKPYVKSEILHRDERDADETNNVTLKINNLNDTHQQLIVHWVGEGSSIIICLARDNKESNRSAQKPSSVYYSYDYGESFQNKNEFFKTPNNSTLVQLDKFYIHSKFQSRTVFADSTNKMIFTTDDHGKSFKSQTLNFVPNDISFLQSSPRIFLAHDKTDPMRKLYITQDFGYTWSMMQEYVKSFDWFSEDGSDKKYLIVQREEANGATIVLKLTPQSLTFSKVDLEVLLTSVNELSVKGDFVFAIKNSTDNGSLTQNKDLLIKYKSGPFIKTMFVSDQPRKGFHIADITENRILVAVHHSETISHLYVSDVITETTTEIRFFLSLERIFCHFPNATWRASLISSVADAPFADLHKVEGLRGIYIASQVKSELGNSSSITPEHLVTRISFDWGVHWRQLNLTLSPLNELMCQKAEECSLHLSQKFALWYPTTRQMPILSSKSAPGLILATGVYGKSSKGHPAVYMSRDAGVTWKQVLKEAAYFNIGDHGGIIVAIKFNLKPKEDPNFILYSTDMGETWQQQKLSNTTLRIYSLMTEPGENTTVFSLFGSPPGPRHHWVIVKAEFLKVFDRNCTDKDYKEWMPYNPAEKKMNCLMGRKEVYKRRMPQEKCYNGIYVDLPIKVQPCPCDQEDFMCDDGFYWDIHTLHCVRNKTNVVDPYAVPKNCTSYSYFYRTKGYKKIPGDVCEGGPREFLYEKIPCPIDDRKEFLLLAQKDRIVMFKLEDPKPEVLPITGLQNVIAVEYDTRSKCVFYADIVSDIISKWCLGSGALPKSIVDSRLHSVEGMAYDWISKHLYFVDGVRARIEVVRTDVEDSNRCRKTIINSTISRKPRGIALHPVAGYMFWSDWVAGAPSINRANLDGSNWTALFGKPTVEWPNGITVDFIGERIYWVDAREDYIASSDYFGKGFKKIMEHDPKVSHPFSVAVFKDNMYWDDWRANAIFVADKDHGLGAQTVATLLPGLMDLKIYAHTIQEGVNGCSNDTICSHMCFGLPENKTSCGCPDDLNLVDGHKCVCPGGKEPLKNGTCLAVQNTCSSSYFKCDNGNCVPNSLKCDGDNDCGDDSDEKCENITVTCQPGMFRCNSGKCILSSWKCDHDFDCPDRSDEIKCQYPTCKPNQFPCDNGRCIAAKWRCDGENDCRDGSDERNCTVLMPNKCQVDEFACGGDKVLCIPMNWKCDIDFDCPDHSDETNCLNVTCEESQFKCKTQPKCIFSTWKCDGDNDCGDNSDEENCTSINITDFPIVPPPPMPCGQMSFECTNKKSCIPLAWKCDRVLDCDDFSDELGCNPEILVQPKVNSSTVKPGNASTSCAPTEFTCASNHCIPQAWICDRQNDCPDASDEKHCDGTFGCKTDGSQFRCRRTGNCISAHQICDGHKDCVDGSDEGICDPSKIPSASVSCQSGFFECDGVRCEPLHKRCDGKPDCQDELDESNCTPLNKTYQVVDFTVDKTFGDEVQVVWSVKPDDPDTVLEFIPSISPLEGKTWLNESGIGMNFYRFTNLTPYTLYNATIYVRNTKLNKVYPPANYLKLTSGKGVPSPPREVTARVLNSTYLMSTIEVTWSPPMKPNGEIRQYTVLLQPPNPPSPWSVDGKLRKAIVSYALENDIEYSITVTAKNDLYESAISKPCLFRYENRAMKKVANLRADSPTDNSITLSWESSKPGLQYEISTIVTAPHPKLKSRTTNETQYTFTGLSPGVDYTFEVKVVGKNEYSEPARVKATTLGSPLPTVSNVAVSPSPDGSKVYLTWDPPKEKTTKWKYGIYYDVNMDWLFKDHKKVSESTNVTLYSSYDLKPCTAYMFDVGVILQNSYGPVTGLLANYFTDNDPKAAPKNVQITPDSSAEPNITIKWKASCPRVTRPVGYMINIIETNTKEKYAVTINASRDRDFSHVFGAKYGCRYNISVSTILQTSRIEWFGFETIRILPPREVEAIVQKNVYKVFWGTDQDRSLKNLKYSYEVLVSEGDELDPNRAKIYNATHPPLEITDLTEEQGYTFAVRIVTPDGHRSELSNPYGVLGTSKVAAESSGSKEEESGSSFPWWIIVCLVGCSAVGLVYWRRKRSHLNSFKNLANSHYNTRSGSTTFSGVNGLDMDDACEIREHFSDDEPLVIA